MLPKHNVAKYTEWKQRDGCSPNTSLANKQMNKMEDASTYSYALSMSCKHMCKTKQVSAPFRHRKGCLETNHQHTTYNNLRMCSSNKSVPGVPIQTHTSISFSSWKPCELQHKSIQSRPAMQTNHANIQGTPAMTGQRKTPQEIWRCEKTRAFTSSNLYLHFLHMNHLIFDTNLLRLHANLLLLDTTVSLALNTQGSLVKELTPWRAAVADFFFLSFEFKQPKILNLQFFLTSVTTTSR